MSMSTAYHTSRVRPGVVKIEIPKITLARRVRDHAGALLLALRQFVRPSRMTVDYPRVKRIYGDNFRGWIRFDITKCISCFQCSFTCPANAIRMKMAPNGKYYPCIDYRKCIFCHFCVDACARGALQSTTYDEIVSTKLESMMFYTENMIESPEVVREWSKHVMYEVERGEVKIKTV